MDETREIMAHRRLNGVPETGLEVKIESKVQGYVDDDNEIDFAGFDNGRGIPSTTDVGTLNLWTSHATACLINQYKKYHSMVGQTTRLRSLREMFETISLEMQKFGYYFSAQKCENKWRVLERKYKNLVFRERLKKPGRIRHYGHWEHKRALDEIFNEKKRHIYLEESDLPIPTGSVKFAQKAIGEGNREFRLNQVEEVPTNSLASPRRSKDSSDKLPIAVFESFLTEMNKNFALAETNREKRHGEKMALRQSELEVQRKLLKLKEQKMEIRKRQMTLAAQFMNLVE